MSAVSQPLEYAPRPSRRRRWVGRALLLLFVLAIGITGWKWGPPAVKSAWRLHLQNVCLDYSAPPDQIVYESRSAEAAALLQTPNYSPLPITDPKGYGNPGPVAAHTPPAWTNYQTHVFGAPAARNHAVLYLGERTARNGAKRLIVAGRDTMNFGPVFSSFNVFVTVWNPGTLRREMWPVTPAHPRILSYSGPGVMLSSKDLRFWAGQNDPTDAARFTIAYEMEGGQGELEGRLSDDGTEVELKIISGPAQSSAWNHPLRN